MEYDYNYNYIDSMDSRGPHHHDPSCDTFFTFISIIMVPDFIGSCVATLMSLVGIVCNSLTIATIIRKQKDALEQRSQMAFGLLLVALSSFDIIVHFCVAFHMVCGVVFGSWFDFGPLNGFFWRFLNPLDYISYICSLYMTMSMGIERLHSNKNDVTGNNVVNCCFLKYILPVHTAL